MKHPPTTSHNYLPKVMEHGLRFANEPGAFYDTDVRHDDWCDLLNNRGFCNCDPIVTTTKRADPPSVEQRGTGPSE